MKLQLKKRPGLREQNMGGELMVCDEHHDLVHVLNPTSAFIWRSMDDSPDMAALEERVRKHFGATPERDIHALVKKALAQFQEKNLLEIEPSGKNSKPSS